MKTPAGTTRPGSRAAAAATAILVLLVAGWTAPPALAQPIDFALGTHRLQGLRPDLAALLLTGRDGGAVELAALALPLPTTAAGPTVPVSLFVEVDGTSLLGPDPAPSPRFELYAYVLDASGGVSAFFAQGIDLDLAEMGEAIYSGGLKFVGGLDLPPGSYTLRLLVTEPASQRWGVRVLPLELPARAAAGAPPAARIVAPPLFAEPPGWWVLAGEAPPPDRPTGGIVAVAASAAPLPAALPVVVPGRAAGFELIATDVPPGALTATVALTGDDGKRHDLAARVGERTAADVPGLERLGIAVGVGGGGESGGDDLAPGRYHLAVEVVAADGARLAAPPLEVVVAPVEGAGAGATWATLGRLAVAADTAAAAGIGADVPPSRRRRRGAAGDRALRALAAGYRDALGQLPAGDAAGATAMMAFEREAVSRAGDTPGVLTEAETLLLTDLARRAPEALVPAMALHLDLYGRYLAARDYFLAVHSRTLVEQAAELYAGAAAGAGGRALAARALTCLGIALEKAQLMARARGLLTRAAALDPHDPTAPLALAAAYEKLGEYAEAVVHLRRLVEADPKSAEGRLRLAINLDRTGDPSGAAVLLGRLVAEDNPRWILSLAYQQLARERLDAGAPAAAARLLAGAVDRLPGDQRLAIALAYARDLAGDRTAARDAVARLAAGGAQPDSSPRLRYNQWPEEGAAQAAEMLQRNARARLAALAAALEGLDGDGTR